MPQFSSGLITAGIGTVLVAFSCKTDDTVKRDGRSSLVSSVASSNAGVYEFTLSQKFPQMIAGVASVQNADGSPADRTCQVGYNATTGVVTVYVLSAATPTDPEANDRINFIGVFHEKSGTTET